MAAPVSSLQAVCHNAPRGVSLELVFSLKFAADSGYKCKKRKKAKIKRGKRNNASLECQKIAKGQRGIHAAEG